MKRMFRSVQALVLVVGVVALSLVSAMPASAQAVTKVAFSTAPIAPAGSIGPGQSVSFNVRVTSNGQADPGGTVYLGLALFLMGSGYGAAITGDSTTVPASQCNGVTVLTGTMIPCTADSQGRVMLTYQVPAQPPSQGRVDWFGWNSPTNPTAKAVDHYSYATEYRFNPAPVAASGSLTAGQSVPVTLSAENGSDQGIAGDTLYLSFNGSGSASVGGTPLTGTPSLFLADGSGNVQISYTAPATLPATGQDSIVVQDLGSSPTVTNADSYAFSSLVPVVSVGDVSVIEGDQHPSITADFTVTLSAPQSTPVMVSYFTLCGIGDKGCGSHNEDFVQVAPSAPKTVKIPAHQTSTVINVPQFSYVGGVGNCIGNCGSGEDYVEGWYVELMNPVGAIIGRSVGEGILLPDIEGVTKPLGDLYIGDSGVVPVPNGTNTPLHFSVTLGAVQPASVTFSYSTTDVSAIAGTDYMAAVSGIGTIPAGATSVVIPVDVLPASPPGANLTFTITISNASGGLAIARATGTGTLLSN
jgi:hypothetical protein